VKGEEGGEGRGRGRRGGRVREGRKGGDGTALLYL